MNSIKDSSVIESGKFDMYEYLDDRIKNKPKRFFEEGSTLKDNGIGRFYLKLSSALDFTILAD